jgi:hypothetical protein
MIEPKTFSIPPEIEEILDRLPSQVTLNVPDHVLAIWFPPGPTNGRMDGRALERAQSYAHSCGCAFTYQQGSRGGIFYKEIPSAD